MKIFKRVITVICIVSVTVAQFAGCGKKDSKTETPIYLDKNYSTEARVNDLLSKMTINQKVAQMIMAERNIADGGVTPGDVTEYGFGAVLSGGGSIPESGNNVDSWANCINGYKEAALKSELGIPILYGMDTVHGNGNVYGATIFPHQIGLGATNDEELVKEIGDVVARETRAIGANYGLSPIIGIPSNERWGCTYQCFGENADLVAKMGKAYVEGLQGEKGKYDYLSSTKIVTTLKHFVGEGQTAHGANQGYIKMEKEEWDQLLRYTLLVPYRDAIEAGAQTLMVSYNKINGVNCHENKKLITDMIKGELKFKGFVISNYDGVERCTGATYEEKLANCVNAGVDMLMEPFDWKECYYTLVKLVKDNTVTEERINDAVRRILTVKYNAGLFEQEIDTNEEQKLRRDIGSELNREVARKAVRESATLLRNGEVSKGKTVMQALKEYKKIAVVGKKADDIGTQCGGWTITWNGGEGNTTVGTTILEGIQKIATDKTITYSKDTSAISKDTEAVIVVVGETPYSESEGDRMPEELILPQKDTKLLKEVSEKAGEKVPVITILITGRPITIADELDYMDALVCVWLPGTEGDGIAEVMFGDYEFTGTTTVTWPWYAEYIEEKMENAWMVLFRNGTGLKKDGTSINSLGTVNINNKPERE